MEITKRDKIAGRRILVTGSNGFVGQHLVERLKFLKATVIEADLACGIDLTDISFLDDLPPVDEVMHLAAKVYVPYAHENPAEVYRTNLMSTLNILELCRRRGIHRLVYVSSYVYGQPEHLPIDENHPISFHSPYNRSKLMGEQLCVGYYEDYGIVPIIFRPFNIYGQGQNIQFLVPTVIHQALYKEKVIVKDLAPKRDYIHVDDVVGAYILALSDNHIEKPEVYNLGSGKSYSVEEIIRLVLKLSEVKKEIVVAGDKRKAEVPDCYADINKAEKQLGWKPEISLSEGLGKMIEFFKESHQ